MQDFESAFSDKDVMITGGLGFIGSNLGRHLLEYGARIILVDSLIPDYGGNPFNIKGIEDKVKVNIADIRDRSGINHLVKGRDYIFNLAGQVSHIDSMRDPMTDLEINCRSQLSLLQACRENNPEVKVIFAGTRQVYGKPNYIPVDEAHPLQPTDVNGINKMAGEWYHILYNKIYGIRTVSLRLTNTYGPRLLMKHNRQGFIPWFIRQVIDGEEITIFGNGQQKRDVNYVDDVAKAFMLVAASEKANGKIYNLGGKEPITLLELTRKIIEVAGTGSYTLKPFPAEKKRIDIGDYWGDYRKINAELGWEPEVEIEDGLEETIEYYRKHKEHYW
ncbi:MAG: NAD-dependent epimerase/dehydratase family protein [Candidatus Glassbacteria bacterium]